MKNKSLFVIGPHHYCHSTAALIEGLNKLGTMKVFSNANHNYCKHPVFNLDAQIKVAKMADYVLLAHSALEEKYKNKIQPLVDEVKDKIDIFLDGSDYSEYQEKVTLVNDVYGKVLLSGSDFKDMVRSFELNFKHFTKMKTFRGDYALFLIDRKNLEGIRPYLDKELVPLNHAF